MRLDKFTTKFQEALSDAQSLALGHDNAYIEPVHMLVAMLRQDEGPRALLQRAGANVPGLLAAAEAAVKRLPQVPSRPLPRLPYTQGLQPGKLLPSRAARRATNTSHSKQNSSTRPEWREAAQMRPVRNQQYWPSPAWNAT